MSSETCSSEDGDPTIAAIGGAHKVVAMPDHKDTTSPHAISVREFVVSQQQQRERPLTPGRRSGFQRPKSPGRAVSRSRDIVQEVYDRMGVNYVRGRSSIELDDDKTTVYIQSGKRASVTKSPGRNRSSTSTSGGDGSSTKATRMDDADALSRSSSTSKKSRVVSRWLPHSSSKNNVVVYPSSTKGNKSQPPFEDGSFPKFSQRNLSVDTYQPDARDEEAHPGGKREERRASPVSIKSRISAFGDAKSTTNTNSVKKPHKSSIRKANSGVAASFLAAVSTLNDGREGTATVVNSDPSERVPIEILPSDPNQDGDDQSYASSFSGEDFAGASSKTPRGGGGSRRATETSVSSLSQRFGGNAKNTFHHKSATEQMIERIVEDRIAQKLKDMADSMMKEIHRVRDETKARVDELEQKLMVLNMGKDDADEQPASPRRERPSPDTYLRRL